MQLVLVKQTSLLGRIIRFFSRGPYSHSAIMLDDGSLIEATLSKGVRRVKDIPSYPKGNTLDFFDLDLTEEQKSIVTAFLIKQIGKSYDIWGALGFLLYTTDRDARKATNKWFCSEIDFAALEKCGYLLLERTSPWEVTPVNLSWSNRIKYSSTITT